MQMAIRQGLLLVKDPSEKERGILSGRMKPDRNGIYSAPADLETLDWAASKFRLPKGIEMKRAELQATRDAIERERAAPDPKPLYPYPVRADLYSHQIRGANMALLTFGWIRPDGTAAEKGDGAK